ncbi:MAG: hypothetical protein AMK69_26105 [Nitrospira bacterium SG8_3]|nr:MAG: hypothetical protein AMK69_26105 [Nitrospira bacterium SG8_3]
MNPQTINLASILRDLTLGPEQGPALRVGNQPTSEKVFSRLMKEGMQSSRDTVFPAEQRATQKSITDRDWLETFRNRLLSAGIPLKDLSLSSKARPALKDLLLAQGLSEDDVKAFLAELFGGDGRRQIEITQLLTKLSELAISNDRKSRDPVLEVSALPHLETLLRSLGLDVGQAGKALDQARVDGGGVGLKGLVHALKGILSSLPEETRAGLNAHPAEEVTGLLARIGMVDEAGKINGPMSLERFVQLLEDKVGGLVSQRVSQGEIENYMNRLLGHVLPESERQGLRSRGKTLGSGKQHLFSVEGLRNASGSKNLKKGVEEMVARGARKTGWIQGGKPSLEKGLQDMVSNVRRQGDESTQADNRSAGLLATARERMTLTKRGPLDQRVHQDTRNALHSAREAVMDRPHMAATEAKQMARPFPLHVVNQVGRQMAFAIRRGETQVRVQLKPPNLGSIQLDMVMKDHVLKVAMITEHHAVKELMMSHVHELRAALVEQGVELQRIDINIDHHFGQSLANAQRDLNGAHSWRSNLLSASGTLESGLERAEEVIQANVSSDALVDMFA